MLADILWVLLGRLSGFIKYSLVGMVGVAINFITLWLLTEKAELWYMLSATIAITLAATNNYILNYLWTFRKRKDVITNHFVGWIKFLASIGMTEVLYLGLVFIFTDKAGVHYMWSAFLALCCTTVLRYVAADKWIWKRKYAKETLA